MVRFGDVNSVRSFPHRWWLYVAVMRNGPSIHSPDLVNATNLIHWLQLCTPNYWDGSWKHACYDSNLVSISPILKDFCISDTLVIMQALKTSSPVIISCNLLISIVCFPSAPFHQNGGVSSLHQLENIGTSVPGPKILLLRQRWPCLVSDVVRGL